MSPVVRNKFTLPDYDSNVSSVASDYPASTGSSDFNDLFDMNDSIFSWDSYDYFAQFCGKLGINLCDHKERVDFLNTIRSQHSLPPVDLDSNRNLIDLFEGLSF